jgi:hypothetical protein
MILGLVERFKFIVFQQEIMDRELMSDKELLELL